MIGMSSFTAYTRWHCLHFKLSGLWRYSSACLHAGQTRISSSSLAIMTCALYDIGRKLGVIGRTTHFRLTFTAEAQRHRENQERKFAAKCPLLDLLCGSVPLW